MPSHAVRKVRALAAAATPSLAQATLELVCGCAIERTIPVDRIIEGADGPIVVGKYPCPAGHPVRAP